jgi:serine/threonine protein kinase/response regulator RpfG family c-di-GMP phosphodiesterase
MQPDERKTVGKYELVRELGRGGMGVVYLARDPVIERQVAIKTVSRNLLDSAEAQGLMQRFKREAQAAGRLTHPAIVAVYEYGEDPEMAYIAMEYVAGHGLEQFMHQGIPMEAQRVRRIAREMLHALDFAHEMGVVHRDIKPSNVMLNADDKVKICDFGIAQVASSMLTQAGTVLGTPSYMSPEQMQGLATDRRADVFSSGVVIYHMLTGNKPFSGDSLTSLMHAVLQGRFEPPAHVNPGLESGLNAVLAKALAVEPAQRFQTAAAFAAALDAAFEGLAFDAAAFDRTQCLPVSAAGQLPTGLPRIRKIDFTSAQRKGEPESARTPSFPGIKSQGEGVVAEGAGRPRVLFVDDETRIVNGLRLLFAQQYEVHIATGGAQALELLGQHHFHLLVSDQRMPNMTGTELLAKARVAFPNTVRILLTGYSDLAAIVGSVNEGEVYRFASKPWDTQEIRALVAEAVAIGLAVEHAPAPVASDARPEEAVLFLDADREIYLAARDVLGRNYRVLYASDLAGALQTLQNDKVGVLVADIEDSKRSHQTFFKLLKQEYPEIVTIAMTEASDSELVIELINQARIFRFLNKPLKLATLQSHVEAGMKQFARQQAQPQFLQQQKVDKKATVQKQKEGSIGSFILGSLRALRKRIGVG